MGYLKSIGIENFRIFANETTFEFAPFTVLTGPNNSGKSSLIRLLKLLKESFNKGSNINKLRFNTDLHSLGDIKSIFSWGSEKDEIKLLLPLPLSYFNEKFFIELTYKMENEIDLLISGFKIFNDKRILVEFLNNVPLSELLVDEREKEDLKMGILEQGTLCLIKNIDIEFLVGMLKNIIFNNQKNDQNDKKNKLFQSKLSGFSWDGVKVKEPDTMQLDEYKYSNIFEKYYKIGNAISSNEIYNKTIKIDIDEEELREVIKKYKNLFDYYPEAIEDCFGAFNCFYSMVDILIRKINTRSEKVLNSLSIIMENIFSDNIRSSIKYIETEVFAKIEFMPVLRGDQSRIYYKENFPEMVDLLGRYSKIEKGNTWVKRFIEDALKNLDFNDWSQVKVELIENSSFRFSLVSNENNRVSLADLGYGYSQILPLLLKITVVAYDNIKYYKDENELLYRAAVIVLEEPEANLHPDLQSKLVDVLIDAAKRFNIQFIIETHSEYIIRKLQLLTARGELKTGDTKIFYFKRPGTYTKNESPVKELHIKEDGLMSDRFGKGFLDEADRIAMELYRIQRQKYQAN